MASDLSKYYKTFSGCDAQAIAVFPDKHIVLGNVTTLSYSMSRTKAHVKTCGRINPRGSVRGSRTLAGTIIFTVNDNHWVNMIKNELPDLFSNINKLKADELPLFDIIISYGNEYGAKSYYVIYGIEITDEGQVVSIENAITENVCQFLARDIDVNSNILPINGVEARTNYRSEDYDLLGVFTLDNLVSDDTYEKSKQSKEALATIPQNPTVVKPKYTSTVDIVNSLKDMKIVSPNVGLVITKDETVKFYNDIRFVTKNSNLLNGLTDDNSTKLIKVELEYRWPKTIDELNATTDSDAPVNNYNSKIIELKTETINGSHIKTNNDIVIAKTTNKIIIHVKWNHTNSQGDLEKLNYMNAICQINIANLSNITDIETNNTNNKGLTYLASSSVIQYEDGFTNTGLTIMCAPFIIWTEKE